MYVHNESNVSFIHLRIKIQEHNKSLVYCMGRENYCMQHNVFLKVESSIL